MNKLSILISACAVMATSVAGAQTAATSSSQSAVVYSLDDCVREALAHNLKLRKADNQRLMSAEQRKEAFTKYFPSASAAAAGFTSNRSLVQMDMGGMGLNLLKNGTTASLVVMQPVFAGGQIVNGNKLAKVGEEASRWQRNMTADEVRLTTETYYWQIVMLKEKLRTIDQVALQIENAHKDAEAAVEAGVRNRNDLLQVELRKNELRTSRIELANNLQVLTDLLGQYIGHPSDSIGVASPFAGESSRPALPASPSRLYVEPESALSHTNEYKLLDSQVDAEKLQYKIEVGKNLPSVAVGGGYVYNDFMDKSASNLVGMVTVSVPLSAWWGGSHAMKRQKLQWRNAEADLQDQSQLLVIRMRKAWNGMNDAYKQVGIAMESIAQSEENLRLNADYYKAGTATISDLLDAQTLYQQAHDKYVEAYTQYEVKKREYLQATAQGDGAM